MAYGVDLPGRIGPYTVERELGAGGMGTVYRARSRGGRTVAVKVARPELAGDPHFRARFRAEVEAARKVGGFHTAQVVDADPEADTPWLATAYVPGPTLSELIGTRGAMDEERLRALGAALAEALQAIHGCGLVHRDLKPGNIIMAEDGPRVLDFGIARAVENTRLTSTGAAFGTPGFLAPEQAQGLEVGPAADVFALGAVLVAAAGGSAFGGGTPMGLMYRSVHETADLSAVPPGVREVVAACLAKPPGERPTPERLLDLFAPVTPPTASPQVPAHPPTVAVRPSRTADAATADGIHHLATRAASASAGGTATGTGTATGAGTPSSPARATPATRATPAAPGASRTRRNVTLAVVLVACALLAGYLARGQGGSGGDDENFPEAAYKIERPEELLDGAYKLEGAPFMSGPTKLDDTATRRDGFEMSSDYKGTKKSGFDTLRISAEYGLFTEPGARMKAMADELSESEDVTASEEPWEKITVPGSKAQISCRGSVCAWADANTIAILEFGGYDATKLAAQETAGIRDEIRRPITTSGS
ncbi:serine/threonine-protein kinase [Streptomyces sp. NPDC050418]|uniref:serine/threonine-protein kinase n=1 Tax=Streptomyces sp. NPDC050418 TaxID=3365612 RepID=UPI0037B19E4F